MTIERIGAADHLSNIKKPDKLNNVNKEKKSDSIHFSAEAKSKGEIYHATELAKSSADVRSDKVAELKQKINDPSYITDKILEEVADRIIEAFGLG